MVSQKDFLKAISPRRIRTIRIKPNDPNILYQYEMRHKKSHSDKPLPLISMVNNEKEFREQMKIGEEWIVSKRETNAHLLYRLKNGDTALIVTKSCKPCIFCQELGYDPFLGVRIIINGVEE